MDIKLLYFVIYILRYKYYIYFIKLNKTNLVIMSGINLHVTFMSTYKITNVHI